MDNSLVSKCDCGLREFCSSPETCALMMRFGLFPTVDEIEEAKCKITGCDWPRKDGYHFCWGHIAQHGIEASQ